MGGFDDPAGEGISPDDEERFDLLIANPVAEVLVPVAPIPIECLRGSGIESFKPLFHDGIV
jgi:hypothetical protein